MTWVQYNDILVISDPQKAAEDKIKVDMARRKAAMPSKITGAILLLFILAGGITYILHKCGDLDYAWCLLIWCLTPFPAILWFAVWASARYIPYTANTRYWMATARSNVQGMHITPAAGGRCSWPAELNILIKREDGKTKEASVSLGYLPRYCDDVKQDVVDFTLDDEDGVWFAPAERKRKEFDSHVMSMKQWAKYYEEGNVNDYDEEDED